MVVKKETKVKGKNLYFWEYGCPFCKKVWEVLEIKAINHKLPEKEKIVPVKIRQFNQTNELVGRYNTKATPTVVIDDIMYKGATTTEYYKGIFEKHFENDILPWLR